jgi:sugar phosphate isomerase/epimerase
MEVGFRFGTIYGEEDRVYRYAIDTARKLGFKALEPYWSMEERKDYPDMAKMAKDAGIHLSAVLCSMDPMSTDDFRKAFEDCKVIGAKSFTSHPHPLNPEDKDQIRDFVERFGKAVEIGEQMGVKLAVHSFGLGPEQWDLMFYLVPQLSLKYDPSFSAQAGRNYVSEIFKYGKRIVHTHAKDEIKLDHGFTYAPPGMGNVHWGAVIAALYEVGFDEQIAIEPHSRYWWPHTPAFERGLTLAKRHLEQFMA